MITHITKFITLIGFSLVCSISLAVTHEHISVNSSHQCVYNGSGQRINVNWVRWDSFAEPDLLSKNESDDPHDPRRIVRMKTDWDEYKSTKNGIRDRVLEHKLVPPGGISCNPYEDRALIIYNVGVDAGVKLAEISASAMIGNLKKGGFIVNKALKGGLGAGAGSFFNWVKDELSSKAFELEKRKLVFKPPKGASAMHVNIPRDKWSTYTFNLGDGAYVKTSNFNIERVTQPFCLQTVASYHFVTFHKDHRTTRLNAGETVCDRKNMLQMTDLNGGELKNGDYVLLYRAEDLRRGRKNPLEDNGPYATASSYINVYDNYVVHERSGPDPGFSYSNVFGRYSTSEKKAYDLARDWKLYQGPNLLFDYPKKSFTGREVFKIIFRNGASKFNIVDAKFAFQHVRTGKYLTAYLGGERMIDPYKKLGGWASFYVTLADSIKEKKYSRHKQKSNKPTVCLKLGANYLSAQKGSRVVSSVTHCRAAEKFKMVDINGGFCIKHGERVFLKTSENYSVGIDSGHTVYVWDDEGEWETFRVIFANKSKRTNGHCLKNGDIIGLRSIKAKNHSRNNGAHTYIALDPKTGNVYGKTNRLSRWEKFGVLFQ